MSETKVDRVTKWVPIFISALALFATTVNAYVTYNAYQLNAETQKAALFSQFQQQYNTIASRFPERILDPNFTPPKGSSDYKKLQDYWIFCYAEWYQTKKSGPVTYQDLWDNYYSGLIGNAI